MECSTHLPKSGSASVYQAALMPWTVNYTRVVILGFGLHVCLKKQRRIEAEDPLIIRVGCNGEWTRSLLTKD